MLLYYYSEDAKLNFMFLARIKESHEVQRNILTGFRFKSTKKGAFYMIKEVIILKF
jgi:hypothetical protein